MTDVAPGVTRTTAGIGPGLAAMLGAGLFAGLAPAAETAGWWLLGGVGLAFCTALCSAFSTSDQSRGSAGSGGGYQYTRQMLGVWPGRMAGSASLVGRVCGGAALAGTFGAYVVPQYPLYGAIGAVALVTVLDAFGFKPSPAFTNAVVVIVLLALGIVVAVCFAIEPEPVPAGMAVADDPRGLLASGGLMFFAFLGFERVTSHGSYSLRQMRVAIPVILLVTLTACLAVGAATLRQLGGARLGLSPAPLRDALAAADGASLDMIITVAAGLASLTALLALMRGIRRTVSSMAEYDDVPPSLAVVGSRGVATPASVLGGVGVAMAAALLNPPQALGLSACLMLFYYAFTNAAARLLTPAERTWPRRAACFGLGLSVLLGMNLDVKYLLVVVVVLVVGSAAAGVCSRYARR
jgi:basic amino acid/polyamine antiporter, APA family